MANWTEQWWAAGEARQSRCQAAAGAAYKEEEDGRPWADRDGGVVAPRAGGGHTSSSGCWSSGPGGLLLELIVRQLGLRVAERGPRTRSGGSAPLLSHQICRSASDTVR